MSDNQLRLPLTLLTFVLMLGGFAVAQDLPEASPTDSESAVRESVPVDVERVSHANSSLILFDKNGRRYVLSDGRYENREGVVLVISGGRIQRLVGCGGQPCDFTTHSTRVVDRRILIYAELEIPAGTYRHDGGSWFRVRDGELVEFQGAP